MITLLLATRNSHKAQEIQAILSERFRYLTLNDFPEAPVTVEDAETFAGNAAKKAVQLADWLAGLPAFNSRLSTSGGVFVLADDSGLEVDALQGAPGGYSARFADLDSSNARNSSDEANNIKLLQLLQDVPWEKRTARFRCVMALTRVLESGPEGNSSLHCANESGRPTELFEGVCEGRIGDAPRGKNGFGYDPLFIPTGFKETFAELGAEIKNQLSHRAQALVRLRQRLLHLA